MRLQPDVVIVQGGARAVRRVDETGLLWTIDANAPGATDLAVGRAMFLAARAVGRVARLDRRGGDLDLVLEPATITEILRDGDLRIEQTLDPDAVLYQSTEPWAGGVALLRDEPRTFRLLPVLHGAPDANPAFASGPRLVRVRAAEGKPPVERRASPSRSGTGTSIPI